MVQAYKAAAIEIVKEYMASADTAEVAEALKELGHPDLQHIFVKQVRPSCWPQQSQETPDLLYLQLGHNSLSTRHVDELVFLEYSGLC